MYLKLLEIAKNDLEAAECLFERKLYPQAVFSLQQSVEKAIKSYGVFMGVISEKEAKEFGHNPLKIYKKMGEMGKKMFEEFSVNIEKVPKLKETEVIEKIDLEKQFKDASYSLDVITHLDQECKEVFFIQKDDIDSFIKEINEIEKEEANIKNIKIPKKELNKAKKPITEFLDALYQVNPQKIEDEKKNLDELLESDFLKKAMKETFKTMIDHSYIIVSLFYFSMIMKPHAIVARYPDNLSGLNPLDVYNENLPLIESFNDLTKIMNKTLSRVDAVIKINNWSKIKGET